MSTDDPRKKVLDEEAEIVFREEFARARAQGEEPSLDDLCQRHPELAGALRILHSFYRLERDSEPGEEEPGDASERLKKSMPPGVARGAATLRYCIRCGAEIIDAQLCAECGAANFFRHVAGPQKRRRARKPGSPRSPVPEERAHRPTAPEGLGTRPPDDRVTMVRRPVAVLRRVSPPHDEHSLYPGITEVGARRPAGLVIDEPSISSRHARIACRVSEAGRPEMAILDHGSTNGTFVNGKRVKKKRLAAGDRVRFADVEFEVRMLVGDEPRMTMRL